MSSSYFNINGHQPHLTDFGLYYCLNSGKDSNGLVHWRVCYEGSIINNGVPVIKGSTVECSPYVEKNEDGSYSMSYVTRYKRGGYHLALIKSNEPTFNNITSCRLITPCSIGSISTEDKIYSVTTSDCGFTLSTYSASDSSLLNRMAIDLGLTEDYSICKISKISKDSENLLMTFVEIGEGEDCFSLIFDPVRLLVSSRIKTPEGGDVYKCSMHEDRIVHAKKIDEFENRSLNEFYVDSEAITWSDANVVDSCFSEALESMYKNMKTVDIKI